MANNKRRKKGESRYVCNDFFTLFVCVLILKKAAAQGRHPSCCNSVECSIHFFLFDPKYKAKDDGATVNFISLVHQMRHLTFTFFCTNKKKNTNVKESRDIFFLFFFQIARRKSFAQCRFYFYISWKQWRIYFFETITIMFEPRQLSGWWHRRSPRTCPI